jgi:hypothetical protein
MRTRQMLACLAVAAVAAAAMAGPVDPPPGPVTPTPGLESRTPISAATTPGDADSVFKITAPGSYFLPANVTGQAAKHGIEITTGGVTIDLNGFELRGVAGSLDGVTAGAASMRNISVLNGAITLWGGDGIDLKTNPVTACRVERITASGNGVRGISAGPASTVSQCTSSANTSDGISVGEGGTVANCIALQNAGNGIILTQLETFDFGGAVRDCSSSGNAIDGIVCASRCTVRGNTCTKNGLGNSGAGIRVTGLLTRVEGNAVNGNQRGVVVTAGSNFITRNTCSANVTSNWDVVSGNVILAVNAATNAAAVTTNAGGTAPGSTDPNANFSH